MLRIFAQRVYYIPSSFKSQELFAKKINYFQKNIIGSKKRKAENEENEKKGEKRRKEIFKKMKKGLTKGKRYDIINNANRQKERKSLLVLLAGVAEQADARDLKSRDT